MKARFMVFMLALAAVSCFAKYLHSGRQESFWTRI